MRAVGYAFAVLLAAASAWLFSWNEYHSVTVATAWSLAITAGGTLFGVWLSLMPDIG